MGVGGWRSAAARRSGGEGKVTGASASVAPAKGYLVAMPLPVPIDWLQPAGIRLLDQTLLPDREVYLELRTVEAVAEAIRALRVRGAPLIGIAAAMGVVIAAGEEPVSLEHVREAIARLAATRPTAVNLHWALRRMQRRADAVKDPRQLTAALRAEAQAIWDEDRAMCERIGSY